MATMTEPQVKTLIDYRVEDGLAIIELNDPPANTYTFEMMHQLDEAILKARFDDGVHVMLLRGHGEKFFSAGANIAMLNKVTPRFKYFFCLHANETLNRLEQTPKLTIAALNGHTVGGGLEIAIARGELGRAPRHRRHAALGPPGGQVAGDRNDGQGRDVLVRPRQGAGDGQ